jgi:hypothetical protein
MTPSGSTYGSAYPFPSQPPSSLAFGHASPYGAQHEQPSHSWGYAATAAERAAPQYNSAVLPSINSMSRHASSSSISGASVPMIDPWAGARDLPAAAHAPAYRSWASQDAPFALDASQSLRAAHPYPSALGAAAAYDAYGPQPQPPARYAHDAPAPLPFAAPAAHYDAPLAGYGAPYAQQPSASASASASVSTHSSPPPPAQQPPPPPSSSASSADMPPLPRHTYTRTLVGPLSANACRLLDEHRKPGIFFLFQDLSVRTEGTHVCPGIRHRRSVKANVTALAHTGTFRLRLRLMHIGPCVPFSRPLSRSGPGGG